MTRPHPSAAALQGTTLIEASAGTGKTYTITTLFLRLLLERKLQVSEILVVTYTKAATAELREKIRDRLRETVAAMEPGAPIVDETIETLVAASGTRGTREADRRRLVEALRGFDEAAISTIHGFCQRMLQENAFESGVAFDTELVTDEGPLREELANDYWAGAMYTAPPRLVRAARAQSVQPSLARLVDRAVSHPTMRVLPETIAGTDGAAAEAAWRAAWDKAAPLWPRNREEILRLLCSGALTKVSYKLETIRGKWAPALDELFAAPVPDIGIRFDKFEKLTPDALAAGTMKKQTTPRHAFFDACRALWDADVALKGVLAAQVLQLQRGVVDFARAESERRKAFEGTQSFDDLLHRLDRALAGPRGAVLAETIRTRFPAALIDEFQDTDPVQYAIFRRVYHGSEGALFLIGDPRQAIYAFRGADVFAYMEAKCDAAAQTFTLTENRRSDPRLLGAINAIFKDRRHEFALDGINFEPMQPPPEAQDRLAGDAAQITPLQILFVPRSGDVEVNKRRINKGWGTSELPGVVAGEIATLLVSGTTIDGRPVEPGDVAVLCRTNEQAVATQGALRSLRVPSALQGDASVFDAPEAAQVERVLRAMADPGDTAAFRAALSTPVIGLNGNEVFALQDNEREWDRLVVRFREWRTLWTTRGFMSAFRAMLDARTVRDDRNVPARLLELTDGERRLTNLLHLGELLHEAASRGHRGPIALVAWLAQMRADRAARGEIEGEGAQIRLESDVRAVKLFTIHKSKGLQFPIVFCPFLWDGRLLRSDDEKWIRFHDPAAGHRLTLDLGSEDLEAHKAAARREALAESLRLLYVALTRARHRCTVVWGAFNEAEHSPLGYLLHQARDAAGDAASLAEQTAQRILALDDDAMRADLDALVEKAGGAILVRGYAPAAVPVYGAGSGEHRTLSCRTPQRTLDRYWRTSSFSALTARPADEISAPAAEGIDRDESSAATVEPEADASDSLVPLHDFPAGTKVGTLLHAILEDVDFRRADRDTLAEQTLARLAEFGVDAQWAERLCDVIPEILATPLPSDAGPFALRDVPSERRLNELRFLFPVGTVESLAERASTSSARAENDNCRKAGSARPEPVEGRAARLSTVSVAAASGAARLDRERLAEVFARHTAPHACPAYAAQIRRLGFLPLEGFVTGSIDLVFEHVGRWYLVDYKSNHLGPRPEDYRTASLVAEMYRHHYFLQYHLYAVALHRHLAQRLPGYDYDRHFGGVFYLFLRGMSPGYAPGTGIFTDRPSRALIEDLSALMAMPGAAALGGGGA